MDKKKAFILIIVLLSAILFTSYSKNRMSSLQGYIHVYGNDPFSYIGIETTDEKQYSISADKEVIKELRKTQGNLIEITGIIIKAEKDKMPGMLKDGKIELAEWRVLK